MSQFLEKLLTKERTNTDEIKDLSRETCRSKVKLFTWYLCIIIDKIIFATS